MSSLSAAQVQAGTELGKMAKEARPESHSPASDNLGSSLNTSIPGFRTTVPVRRASKIGKVAEREFFIDNLLVRIHFIIVMIRWIGLAPWEFELPFPGSLTSTFLDGRRTTEVPPESPIHAC